jgi:two-component system cell cycle response regulator
MTARVLVVDDLQPNIRLLEAKLTGEYFDVITADSGPAALELVATQRPDIVLLDVMMPGMDGFEVCERIKSDPRTAHIPVVMVTALSDVADRVRGLDAGADDFLTKPVNDLALFARVRSLVRLKMMMDEWRLREQTSSELGVLSEQTLMLSEKTTEANVLVLDDSVLESERITEILTEDSHRVELAATTKEALDRIEAESFDLVIASLGLREEDSLRFCSQLRSMDQTRQLPILLVVEEHETERLAKGLDLGVNDYLVRPIDRNELLARIRTQIRRRRYHDRLRHNYELSLAMALTDSLTGLYNRRYLMTHLESLCARGNENAKAMSLLMFDIDYFKTINDTNGHAVGDAVLRELAERVSYNVRTFDTVARYGGEEFVVVMPDTALEVAVRVAERLREIVAERPFRGVGTVSDVAVTISMGVASQLDPSESPESLIDRADRALYEAKRAGRNRVVVSAPNAERAAAS